MGNYQKYIINILQCVCWKCSKLYVDINNEEVVNIISKRKGASRFKSIVELCSKVKRCGEKNINGCGILKPNTIKKNPNGLGKLISKVFAPTGKKITINLLRSIYVSENVDLDVVKKNAKIAEAMRVNIMIDDTEEVLSYFPDTIRTILYKHGETFEI